MTLTEWDSNRRLGAYPAVYYLGYTHCKIFNIELLFSFLWSRIKIDRSGNFWDLIVYQKYLVAKLSRTL